MGKNGTYIARAWCKNCGVDKIVEIPKGISMAVYAPKIKCDICECDCDIRPIKD